MVDENGANICGVREEFGLGYTLEKGVSCQMHFKADILKHMSKIGPSYREEFWKCACELCITPTESRYNEVTHLLYQFAEFNPETKNVLDFYDARKYHLFPAFRRFGYSGVTMAESGWAKVKRSGQLWLLDAARDDIYTMIIQCSDIAKYREQTQDVVGDRAPNQAQKAANSRVEQIKVAKKFAEEFDNSQAFKEHLEESISPRVFVPGPKIKHKAGRGNSISGRFMRGGKSRVGGGSILGVEETENTMGMGVKRGYDRGGRNRDRGGVRGICRGGGRGVLRGNFRGLSRVNNNKNTRGTVRHGGRVKKTQNNIAASSIEDILRRGEEILQEDETKFDENVKFSRGVDGRGGYNPVDNPPAIVLFLGKSISKCQDCLGTIKREALSPPQDMCLTTEDFRSYYCHEEKIQKAYYGNI